MAHPRPHRQDPRRLRPLLGRSGGRVLGAALPALMAIFHGSCTPAPAAHEVGVFDTQRAWKDLERMVGLGPRPSGSEAIEELRRFLEGELRASGLEPRRETFRAHTPAGEIEFANVFADLPGAGDDAPMVVLCTHFDTKRMSFEFVGANDGGSGTTVLLELARVLVADPRPRRVTYRFLFLDGEEAVREQWEGDDNTYGSRHHVQQLRERGTLERVRACVLLDLVGDADLRLFREGYSEHELLELFFQAARDLGLGAHVDGPRQPILDDHLSFMAAGVPSVNLIDFRYGPGNAYWHSPQDTLENVAPESLESVGRIVLAGLPELEAWVLRR